MATTRPTGSVPSFGSDDNGVRRLSDLYPGTGRDHGSCGDGRAGRQGRTHSGAGRQGRTHSGTGTKSSGGDCYTKAHGGSYSALAHGGCHRSRRAGQDLAWGLP